MTKRAMAFALPPAGKRPPLFRPPLHQKTAPEMGAVLFGAEGGIAYSYASKLTSKLDAFIGMNANPRLLHKQRSCRFTTPKKEAPYQVLLFFGAEGGIRTLVWFPTN